MKMNSIGMNNELDSRLEAAQATVDTHYEEGRQDGWFKTRHPLVLKAFDELDNYLVIDDGRSTGWCCVYFSSNSIYYPSDEATFRKEILEKNRFEFFGTRLHRCSRHIFVRDIHKQWYLRGINGRLNSIEKVAAFLKEATEGYRVITLGSSAGGYAAALFATLLGGEYSICVDAQFNLYDDNIFGHLERNPIVDEQKDSDQSKYYRLNDILGPVPVDYFCSALSAWDQRSMAAVRDNPAVRLIPFKSDKHGGPFSSMLYEHVFDMPQAKLEKLVGRMHHPRLFLLRHLLNKPTLRKLWARLRKRFF